MRNECYCLHPSWYKRNVTTKPSIKRTSHLFWMCLTISVPCSDCNKWDKPSKWSRPIKKEAYQHNLISFFMPSVHFDVWTWTLRLNTWNPMEWKQALRLLIHFYNEKCRHYNWYWNVIFCNEISASFGDQVLSNFTIIMHFLLKRLNHYIHMTSDGKHIHLARFYGIENGW